MYSSQQFRQTKICSIFEKPSINKNQSDFVTETSNMGEEVKDIQMFLLNMAFIRHFSLLNVNAAGACGYDFLCDGG